MKENIFANAKEFIGNITDFCYLILNWYMKDLRELNLREVICFKVLKNYL